MFGYIAPVFRSLTGEQQTVWRAYYCGVCHSLKSRFGQTGRLSLSHDMTFLALLLSSLYEPDTEISRSRCALHPVHAHTVYASGMIDYAADMNILLFYYKALDQRMDDGSFSGRAAEKTFRNKLEKVRAQYPRQSVRVQESLKLLWEGEKAKQPDPDLLCNLSGRMLGSVFVPDPDDLWAPQLYAVGEGLGRFVYWMDAWEDLEEDRKKNRFNPLLAYSAREDYEAFCRETLEMLIAEATEHFELLPLERDLPLLRNVLYSGIWQRYALRMEQRERKEARRHGK